MNQLIQVAQIYDKGKNSTNGRVYDPNGISPTLTTPTGGNSMPLILAMEQILGTDYKSPHLVVERGDGELDMSDPETRIIKRAADHVAQEYGTQTRFRIRKLTPRECYRLMDVPEEYIDRLLASGISKSQHYKLAGNSIVVSCLYHIFKNLFTHEIPANQQLSLF